MTATHKPFSLTFDMETTRAGEETFADPDPISEDFARRLRDIERAGRLRNLLVSAETGAWESARFLRFTLGREAEADAQLRAADVYRALYVKVIGLQARARGEVGDV